MSQYNFFSSDTRPRVVSQFSIVGALNDVFEPHEMNRTIYMSTGENVEQRARNDAFEAQLGAVQARAEAVQARAFAAETRVAAAEGRINELDRMKAKFDAQKKIEDLPLLSGNRATDFVTWYVRLQPALGYAEAFEMNPKSQMWIVLSKIKENTTSERGGMDSEARKKMETRLPGSMSTSQAKFTSVKEMLVHIGKEYFSVDVSEMI